MKHKVGRREEGEGGFLRCFLLVSPSILCVRDSWWETVLCRAVYPQIQLCIPEERAEIHYRRTHMYILYQAKLAAFTVRRESFFLAPVWRSSPLKNDLSKVRQRKSKSLKGLAQTRHLCGGHSEVKRIRLPQ